MLPGHERTTPIGAVLSHIGADETPQILYDIWRGAMGIIGVRPLLIREFITMRKIIRR